jgi:hypothetical protein
VQVHDDVFHFSIIDGALGICTPSSFSGVEIGEYSHQIEFFEVYEIKTLRIADASAHDKVKFFHCLRQFAGNT